MTKGAILLVSTNKQVVKKVRTDLKKDYEILVFDKLLDGIDIMRETDFEVILLDNTLKNFTLKEASRKIGGLLKDVYTIALTNDKEEIANIDDNIRKPLNSNELKKAVEYGIKTVKLIREKRDLERKLESHKETTIIGQSNKVIEMRKEIDKASKMDSTVLIIGQTGTGKELVARKIHEESLRSEESFNKMNCSNVSRELMEKELFGYEKGELIGPNMPQKGILELSNNGTVFIEAIDMLDTKLQKKLLKVIEYGKFKRKDSGKTRKLDVRFIIATDKNLEEEVKKGRVKKELYHRLTTFSITVPSLKERKKDIPLLSNYFLNKVASKLHKGVLMISGEAMKYLVDYSFPGNIRELKNIVERLAITSKDKIIDVENLPLELKMKSKTIENRVVKGLGPLKDILEKEIYDLSEAEKVVIGMALQKTRWNKQEAAKLLGIGRTTLYEKIRKYELDKDDSSKK
ncbi:MAG: sigma-54-dependent transcriptional regulator [Fusobacteriota bacterium]